MALTLAEQLNRQAVPNQTAKVLADAIQAAGPSLPISSDDIAVPAIDEANFDFAGGTLTEFCEAIAAAIPAP